MPDDLRFYSWPVPQLFNYRLSASGSHVRLDFDRPPQWLLFDVASARGFAMELLKHADEVEDYRPQRGD